MTANATRNSWKILPTPDEKADVNVTRTFTSEEMQRIAKGLIPLQMEDKWFVFLEEPWLYFHRSWTGICIYGLRLESTPSGTSVVASWVNRNRKQWVETSTDDDRVLVQSLIDVLLLGRT